MRNQHDLKPKQKKILRAYHEYQQENDRPGSFRDIAGRLEIAHSNVKYHADQMVAKGYLDSLGSGSRGFQVTGKGRQMLGLAASSLSRAIGRILRLPISGDIVAGEPVHLGNDGFGTYDEDDEIVVDSAMLPSRVDELYALRVRGESMIDALINDGDIVILQKCSIEQVRNGDTVAAFLRDEHEMTLKEFYWEKSRQVRLQPKNPTMDPIYVAGSNLEIHGKLVYVQRSLTV